MSLGLFSLFRKPTGDIFERGSLCRKCSKIEWELLRGPTIDQLSDSSEEWRHLPPGMRVQNINVNDEATWKHWDIGSLSAIKRRAGRCALCSILCNMSNDMPAYPGSHIVNDTTICKAYLAATGKRSSMYYEAAPLGSWVFSLGFRWSDPSNPMELNNLSKWLTVCSPPGQRIPLALEQTPVPKKFDIVKVHAWIQECRENHEDCREIVDKDTRTVKVFRLIDIQSKCIRTFSNYALGIQEYVTLSYVWGHTENQKLKLKNGNVEKLSQPMAFDELQPSRTIMDAMELSQELGFRYIWVDALCIIQDNPQDTQICINTMGNIYQYSALNIVVGGYSAVDPLWGFTTEREEKQQWLKAGKSSNPFYLMTSSWFINLIGQSFLNSAQWLSRGWTMQELYLSPRSLIIQRDEVGWLCRCSQTSEGISFSPATFCDYHMFDFPVWRPPRGDLEAKLRAACKDLGTAIFIFTQRRLTNSGDAFNAFSGITTVFEQQTGIPCIWGIPATHFELGIVFWKPPISSDIPKRRHTYTTTPLPGDTHAVKFPSWSQLSWENVTTSNFSFVAVFPGYIFKIAVNCYIWRAGKLSRTLSLAPPEVQQVVDSICYPGNTITREPERPGEMDINRLFTAEYLASLPSNGVLFFYADVVTLRVSANVGQYGEYCLFLPLDERNDACLDKLMVDEIPKDKRFGWVRINSYHESIRQDEINEDKGDCIPKELELVYMMDRHSPMGFYVNFIPVIQRDGFSELIGWGFTLDKDWRDKVKVDRRLIVLR